MSLILILVLILYFGWRNYNQDWGLKALQVIPLQAKLKKARARIEELEAEHLSLQDELASLIRQSKLDQKAMKQTRTSLQQRQFVCLKMEEELAFLKHMVSPDKPQNGIKIQRIRLQRTETPQEFSYKFTVSQGLNQAQEVSGWIHLKAEGETEGKPRLLNLQEITDEKIKKIKMQFKHFQDFVGTIRLPKGFTPKKLVVEIMHSNKKLKPLKKSIGWIVTD